MFGLAERLARDLGMYYAYVGCEEVSETMCGNAVLSCWPITRTAAIELPNRDEYDEVQRESRDTHVTHT